MRLWLDAVVGVTRRDAILFFSYRSQVFTQTVGLLLNLTLFYYLSRLVTAKGFGSSAEYFAFVVVGLVIVQVLITTIGLSPVAARQELVAGTLERLLVSPFGVINGILAMLVFPLLEAFATGTIMLVLGALVFGLHIAPTAPLALPVALLGAFSFVPFTLLLVAIVLSFKQATAGTSFVASGVAIAGGLYFPVSVLPDWIRWTSYVQPFTPAADLLRHLLVDAPLQDPAWVDLVKLIGFGTVLLPVAALALRWAVGYGQRRGTIFEY